MTSTEQPLVPAQPTGRTPADLVEAYAAAWNAHDGAAVAALVSGTYTDPTLPAPVAGEALAAMVDGLCSAFPDLRFEHVRSVVDGTTAVFEWRMHGTNDGAALPGAPAPTGGTIDLPGIDVITTDGSQILDVAGYFDQKAFVEQLGLTSLVVPQDSWPVSFGTSVRMDLGHTTAPGALTLTWIEVEDGEEGELVRRTTDILTGLASEPAFLGFQSTTVGRRATTLTAWTSVSGAESALARSGPHRAAMSRVEQDGYGARGWTGFWQPARLNAQFVGCTCGEPVALEGPSATCACGEAHEVLPYL